mmetsp:Transcript_22796/g.48041  ORF Transcript_22796/g.48041 Transcript_22796/m.48041 type:complete len:93 (-) Transcript_22796:715-993(-)
MRCSLACCILGSNRGRAYCRQATTFVSDPSAVAHQLCLPLFCHLTIVANDLSATSWATIEINSEVLGFSTIIGLSHSVHPFGSPPQQYSCHQ